MPIDFYYAPYSPPCRPVLMLAEGLKLKLNLKPLDTKGGEHLKPDFIKINPQHCIPTIVDDGFALWESRVILTYLASKYGDGSLYPTDPKKKALVDQRLFFDMGTLYQRYADWMYPQIFANQPADEAKFKRMEEALGFLNSFLEGNQWVAGSTMTIADISIISTLTVFQALDVDIFKYPNIKEWFQRAKISVPGFKLCEEGIETFKNLVQEFKAKHASK